MLGLDHSGGLILFQAWLNIDVLKSSSPRFLSISSWLVSQRLSRAVSAGGVTRHTSAPETDLQRLRWQGTEPHRCQTGQRACVSCQTGTHTHTAQLHTLMFWQWFTSWNIILFLLLQSSLKLAKGGEPSGCFKRTNALDLKVTVIKWRCVRVFGVSGCDEASGVWSAESVAPPRLYRARGRDHTTEVLGSFKTWFAPQDNWPFLNPVVKYFPIFC